MAHGLKNNRLVIVTLEPGGTKVACFHRGECLESADTADGGSRASVEMAAADIADRTGTPIERVHHQPSMGDRWENWSEIAADIGLDQLATPTPHVALVRQYPREVREGPVAVALYVNGRYVIEADVGAAGQTEWLESVAIGLRTALLAPVSTIDVPASALATDDEGHSASWKDVEDWLTTWGVLPGAEAIQPPQAMTTVHLHREDWDDHPGLVKALCSGSMMTWHTPGDPLGPFSDFVTFVDPSTLSDDASHPEGSDTDVIPEDIWLAITRACRESLALRSSPPSGHVAVWVSLDDAPAEALPGLVIERPDWVYRRDLADALQGSKIMNWADGSEPIGEYADFVTFVDASCNGEGPDSNDLPADIWGELVSACKATFGPRSRQGHYPVRVKFST